MSGLQGDLDVSKSFCNYINKCFKLQSEILSYNKGKDLLPPAKPTTTRSRRLSKRLTILDLSPYNYLLYSVIRIVLISLQLRIPKTGSRLLKITVRN